MEAHTYNVPVVDGSEARDMYVQYVAYSEVKTTPPALCFGTGSTGQQLCYMA